MMMVQLLSVDSPAESQGQEMQSIHQVTALQWVHRYTVEELWQAST